MESIIIYALCAHDSTDRELVKMIDNAPQPITVPSKIKKHRYTQTCECYR